jgi:hypothetical protein
MTYIQRKWHRASKTLSLQTRVSDFLFPPLMAQFVSGCIFGAFALDILQFSDLFVFYRHFECVRWFGGVVVVVRSEQPKKKKLEIEILSARLLIGWLASRLT